MNSPASLQLSVVICTHNPDPERFARVLDALRAQTLACEAWELIVIDNTSATPVADAWDLGWKASGRHVREDELGVAAARIRGLREAAADLIVFVDDDNLLAPTYLQTALAIGAGHPFLGAWGGSIVAEFERPPPAWTRRYWPRLAIRTVPVPTWSNHVRDDDAQPFGAGLCVRATVAEAYVRAVAGDALRRNLGRKGRSLVSGEDTDLALCSRELGLGWGVFPTLELTHLIPPWRLQEDYLLRLVREMNASSAALAGVHGAAAPRLPLWRVLAHCALELALHGRRAARFYWAGHAGAEAGLRRGAPGSDAGAQTDAGLRTA